MQFRCHVGSESRSELLSIPSFALFAATEMARNLHPAHCGSQGVLTDAEPTDDYVFG